MKKTLTLIIGVLFAISLNAQNEQHLYLHHSGAVIYNDAVHNIDGITFQGNPAFAVVDATSGQISFPVTMIDSITFGIEEAPSGDIVRIVYNGNSVEITNPFSNEGVSVSNNQADVVVSSSKANVIYSLSGTTSNGSITFMSSKDFDLILDNANLSSASKAVIDIASETNVTIELNGTSTLSDGSNGAQKAAICSAGDLAFTKGDGTLNINGNTKHGIFTEGNLIVSGGKIIINDAQSDGLHIDSFTQTNGEISILHSGSDGIDSSTDINIFGGSISINSTSDDTKGLSASETVSISGGTVEITSSGYDSKAIKCDDLVTISGGSIEINHSGDISKGIKSAYLNVSGGEITITASGKTVVEQEENQEVPSYCSAIKIDTEINITGGNFNINLPISNDGGKAISCDGNTIISGGTFELETHGDGASYTVSGNTKDAYTSSCIKCDGSLEIIAGSFNCTSTGKGGKGINADGNINIGHADAPDRDLIINISTSGERVTISSGGGGPWGGGDYANPKALKCNGDMTINSGIIIINCTQNNEGGECLESKAQMTINGGNIEAYSKSDDVINATRNLTINGGTIYCHSDNNDAIDSNGTLFINGGLTIANGARQPECGFDCDNNQFKITGGIVCGTGGDTSNPTANVCTQPSLKINTQAGYAIQVLNASGEVVVTYQCPTLQGGGGGGPGGGSGIKFLLSHPDFATGQTYTVKYNGTISSGDNWNGYYTGNVTYSGGQQTTVTLNSMVTTVNAGGGGW
ncbi:MAG: carbohydrate-binding domain-containing protein [Bacteroidales bacterium]|nr:carbohydrate-binding domain-containing protein [Bacteroidales bacterium]